MMLQIIVQIMNNKLINNKLINKKIMMILNYLKVNLIMLIGNKLILLEANSRTYYHSKISKKQSKLGMK